MIKEITINAYEFPKLKEIIIAAIISKNEKEKITRFDLLNSRRGSRLSNLSEKRYAVKVSKKTSKDNTLILTSFVEKCVWKTKIKLMANPMKKKITNGRIFFR